MACLQSGEECRHWLLSLKRRPAQYDKRRRSTLGDRSRVLTHFIHERNIAERGQSFLLMVGR